MEKKLFFSKLFNEYDQIAVFVQKQNDLDTCCCACAIAELISHNYSNKTISMLGLYGTSKFLPENKKYKNKPIDWTQKTLVILSEVTSLRQIDKWHLENIRKAERIIVLDHHENNEQELKELLQYDEINDSRSIIRDEKATSVCEVLLGALYEEFRDKTLEIPKRIGEILFMGLYGDTQNLAGEHMTKETFINVARLIDLTGMNVSHALEKMRHRPIENLKIFARCIEDSVKEGNMIVLSLNPRMVQKAMPRLFIRDKKGQLKQKSMLTYIPRWVKEFTDANTIVFIHYSLFDPFESTKRYVYIILAKKNPALEHILREYGFKQNRNRWSREMNFYNLTGLLEQYKTIFTM